METSTQRVFGLDAVRCLAILLVVACHGSLMVLPWFDGHAPLLFVYAGSYGVTLFFSLSGFLIGRILIRLAEQGADWRTWLAFMRRRWARTLPLYFICLLILSRVWPSRALDPAAYEHVQQALPWFATLTQNLAWPMRANWFSVSWSLCVEEWFYLLFSAALLAGAGVFGRRLAFWLALGVLLALPPVLRAMLPGWNGAIHSDSGIVLLRLDAAGYGVLLAWASLRGRWAERHAPQCFVAGMTLLALQVGGTLAPLLGAAGRWGDAATLCLIPLAFALCLPAAAANAAVPAWLARPVRAVSDQSYSIYLCHLSILEWTNYELRLVLGLSPLACLLFAAAAVWGLSLLAFRFVEQPILARAPRPGLPAMRPAPRPIARPVGRPGGRPAGWPAGAAAARPLVRSGGRRRQLAPDVRASLAPEVATTLLRDRA